MKKSIVLFFIVLLPLFSFSQALTLSGKVMHLGVSISADRKIYFTFDEEPLSEQHFLTYNEQYEYTWSVPIGQLKKDSVKSVFFSSHVNIPNELLRNACGVQEIRLDSVLNPLPLSNKNNINVESDLILDLKCPPPLLFDGVSNWNAIKHCDGPFCAKIPGRYTIEIDGVTYPLQLDDINNPVVLKEVEKGLFHEKYGIWKYDSTSQTLTLSLWLKGNEASGLLKIIETETYRFKVIEAEMQFDSPDFKLSRTF